MMYKCVYRKRLKCCVLTSAEWWSVEDVSVSILFYWRNCYQRWVMFVTTPFLALCDLQNKIIVELNDQLNIYGTHWIGLIGRMVEFSDGMFKVTGQFMSLYRLVLWGTSDCHINPIPAKLIIYTKQQLVITSTQDINPYFMLIFFCLNIPASVVLYYYTLIYKCCHQWCHE